MSNKKTYRIVISG